MLGSSWIASQLAAFQEWLNSVSKYVIKKIMCPFGFCSSCLRYLVISLMVPTIWLTERETFTEIYWIIKKKTARLHKGKIHNLYLLSRGKHQISYVSFVYLMQCPSSGHYRSNSWTEVILFWVDVTYKTGLLFLLNIFSLAITKYQTNIYFDWRGAGKEKDLILSNMS
jgi:hypothetical protein